MFNANGRLSVGSRRLQISELTHTHTHTHTLSLSLVAYNTVQYKKWVHVGKHTHTHTINGTNGDGVKTAQMYCALSDMCQRHALGACLEQGMNGEECWTAKPAGSRRLCVH